MNDHEVQLIHVINVCDVDLLIVIMMLKIDVLDDLGLELTGLYFHLEKSGVVFVPQSPRLLSCYYYYSQYYYYYY